jgi:hypothetical protein
MPAGSASTTPAARALPRPLVDRLHTPRFAVADSRSRPGLPRRRCGSPVHGQVLVTSCPRRSQPYQDEVPVLRADGCVVCTLSPRGGSARCPSRALEGPRRPQYRSWSAAVGASMLTGAESIPALPPVHQVTLAAQVPLVMRFVRIPSCARAPPARQSGRSVGSAGELMVGTCASCQMR